MKYLHWLVAFKQISKNDALNVALEVKTHNGWTPLMVAVCLGKEEAVRILLEAGANVNATDNGVWTALMIAVRNYFVTNAVMMRIIKLLLAHKASVNLVNEEGWSALMIAVRHVKCDSAERYVELLLAAGANVEWRDTEGCTALMIAVRHVNCGSTKRCVEILLAAGANVDVQNHEGYSALMLAAQYANAESSELALQLLLAADANVNLKDGSGFSAIELAAGAMDSTSSERTVELLFEAGARIDCNDEFWSLLFTKYPHFAHRHMARAAKPRFPMTECPICLEPLDNGSFWFLCGHALHSLCFVACTEAKCPMCRLKVKHVQVAQSNWTKVNLTISS